MKRFFSCFLVTVLMALSFAGCSRGGDGEVAVFYYTYSDAYISSVRSALDKYLDEADIDYNDYDANGNQSSQTDQIDVAVSKGATGLIVNVVYTGSNDAASTIVEKARAADIPLIFFNRSVDESVVSSYEKCVFVGTDYELAGHMQGEMIGNYLLENYDAVDINKDGKISYVLFKGQEGNMEAIARTKYAVEDCNALLKEAGKPELLFYDEANVNSYLVDQDGLWSASSATNYMSTILAQYSESNKNMVELVIANNDEMALGAVSALEAAGYNKKGGKTIPVFGVDATDAAKEAIKNGRMTGTIKQDAEAMADVISKLMTNLRNNEEKFKDINKENIIGSWRVNIPYAAYTKEQ